MEPNVLLVVLDSVRMRNTGLGGHVNDTTPFLDRFAAERATSYTEARAPGARSITSHASLFTGLAVEEHGVTSADHRLRPGTTVFETLRDAGYATGVFSENVWITDVGVGLSEGFDRVVGPQNVPFPQALNPKLFVAEEGPGEYVRFVRKALGDDDPVKSLINGVSMKTSRDFTRYLPGSVSAETSGERYRDAFLDWHDGVDGPWAACVNLMDAHAPYLPEPDYDNWGDETLREIEHEAPGKWELQAGNGRWWTRVAREALYDGAVRQADAYLEDIVDSLEARGDLDDTLIVITSDHGEGFGEPSRIRDTRVAGHNVSVHEVVLHVPLVVKRPGQRSGEVVDDVVSIARFPDAVSASRDDDWSAPFRVDEPVVATTYGLTEDDQLRARALRYCDDVSVFDGIARVVYDDEYDHGVRKYVTWKDRSASISVLDAQTSYRTSDRGADVVAAAFEEFEDAGVREEAAGMDDVDDETYGRLEELGYV